MRVKKKKLFIIYICIFLIISTSFAGIYYRHNLNERNTKLKVANITIEYLMGKETFKNEILEQVDVKYDKQIRMYIVSVKFQSNPKKAVVIVSDDYESSHF